MKKTNIVIKGHVWEFSGAVVVDDAGDFVCKRAVSESVGNGLVINVVNDVALRSHVGRVIFGIGVIGFNTIGHAGVRDRSQDTDAWLFQSGRMNSFARTLHVAF